MGGAATCVGCAAVLPAGAVFCPSCGVRQPESCRSCGAPLDAEARFCSRCGAATAAPADTSPAPRSERRWASVLFADLVGFTTLSEARDPEQVRELLSRYFARCREIIASYDGVVEKFIGDAVMAVWGAPTAHEDDAERAVRAGAGLAAMVTDLGEELHAPLALRVGVVTGEVAANLGSASEGIVAGDPVNTASRVQSAASPGQVWVDAATRALTAHVVEYADTGEHQLKGKAEPVRLYAATRVHEEPVLSDAIEVPMVGRDAELGLLRELFLSAAAERRPRLVVVDGDAGVGKSRLLLEFQRWLDSRGETTRWHRGRCLSYGDGIAFRALSEAVRTRLGLVEGEVGSVVSARLDAALDELAPGGDERPWLRTGLAVLVGEEVERAPERGELFAAWTRFFELVGAGDPVVLVIDDAQHADDGLLDFVEQALSSTRSAFVVIALSRSELLERRPGWGGRHAAVIPLNPLGPDAMDSLLADLLGGLPDDARRQLAERTGGNPLFAVETVRALVDERRAVVVEGGRARLVGDVDGLSAPASLRSLVRSRLDALPADARGVVADAAVLGLTCTLDGLAALAPEDVDLETAVADLQRREILTVEEDRFSGERGQLRFVHAVVRQVAYETLSRRDRKTRHLAAAEHLAAQDAPELDAVIAQHLLDALDAAFDEDADRDAIRLSAVARLESAATHAAALGSPGTARRQYLRAARLSDDPSASARLLTDAAEQGIKAGEQVEVVDEATEALEAFDRLGDRRGSNRALSVLAHALNWSGRYHDMRQLLEERVPDPRAMVVDDRASFDVLTAVVTAWHNLGIEAIELDQKLVRAGENSDDPAMRYMAETCRSDVALRAGDRQGVMQAYRAAADIARQPGSGLCEAISLNNLASIAFEDDGEAALALVREGLTAARRAGQRNAEEWCRASELEFLVILGRYREALQILEHTDYRDFRPQTQLLVSAPNAWLAAITGQIEPFVPEVHESESWSSRYIDASRSLALSQIDGDLDAVVDAAREALHALVQDNGGYGVWDVLPHVARIALVTRDPALGAEVLEFVAPSRGEMSALASAVRPWVLALVGEPPPDEREDLLRSAVPLMRSFGLLGYAALAEGDVACWLLAHGRTDEGATALDEAVAHLDEVGALGWSRRLRERSRAADPWTGI